MRSHITLMMLLILGGEACASIESEVESERFKREKGVLVDTWTNQVWQDQQDNESFFDEVDVVAVKTKKGKKYKIVTTSRYCQKLNLFGRKDWRLPKKDELINIYKKAGNRFRYLNDGYYWTDEIVSRPIVLVAIVDRFLNVGSDMMGYRKGVRCVSGRVLGREEIHKMEKTQKKRKMEEKAKYIYNKYRKENNVKSLKHFLGNYKDISEEYYYEIKRRLYGIYQDIFKEVKTRNNIAGYEWFINKYPDAPQVKEAMKNIYELAFKKAKEINTIEAYNTFVYNYPLAPQVREANERAYKLEEKKYTNLGFAAFFNRDAKMEKMARKLLIKAKQIERYPIENGKENRKYGYLLVANRMYRLLQEKFDDTDATLRYLESQEFKDFVKSFNKVMESIKNSLEKIDENTLESRRLIKDLVNISSKGFADAKADRAMAEYYARQHREWQKNMHYLDKGYR